MRENRERAFEWVARDEDVEEVTGAYACWDSLRGDELPSGVDYFVFDCAVVCGVEVAKRWLRTILRLPTEGEVDREVLDKLGEFVVAVVLDDLEFLRRRRHHSEPKWDELGEVLTNRVNRVKRRALSLTGGDSVD